VSAIDRPRYHENLILVMGFLGSIAFAALILVLQSSSEFKVGFSFRLPTGGIIVIFPQQYFAIVVTCLILTSIFSIMGCIAAAEVAATKRTENRPLEWYSEGCMLLGLTFFMISLPMLVAPSDIIAGNPYLISDLFIFEGALGILLGLLSRPKKKTANP